MHPFLANKKQKKCTPNTQPAKCTTFFPSVSAAKQIPQEISLYSPFCIKSPLSHSSPREEKECCERALQNRILVNRDMGKPQFQGLSRGKQQTKTSLFFENK